MAILRVTDIGSVGIISDVEPTLLPPNAWTAGQNIRFTDGSVQKFTGHQSVATPTVEPYYIIPVVKGTTLYWVYCGLDKVYNWAGGSTHNNITRQTTGSDVDYTGAAGDRWNGGMLNGVLVLTNGVDSPQMWTGTILESLTWDGSNTWGAKGDSCKVLRPYRNFLVALDWNDGSNRYPHTVYWSNRADPLTIPSDWDYADPANEAGQFELSSTSGFILDGLQLRDSFVIYKEDAVHLMTEVGGTFVHNFRDVSKTTGILAQSCAGEFYGRHFVFGNDDCYVHDGQSIESVASKRVRREIFNAIDTTYYNRSFVVRNLANNEMWCCFAETGSAVINRAAVWNWKDGTWAHRALPSSTFINHGVLFSTSDSAIWSDDSNAWDTDTTTWASRAFNPSKQELVAACPSNLFQLDSTTQFAGANITSYVTREGLVLEGMDTVKHIKAVYPRTSVATTLTVSIGSKLHIDDGYSWEGPYTITTGTADKVDVRSTGRVHAIKFTFPAGAVGDLQGYDLDYTVVGKR